MKSQSQSLDRISALPQDTIEQILTLMPIRDALRTSILSKKWRYCWTGIPKLVLDDKLVNISSDNEEIIKYKFVTAIFHVLLLHKGPISELCICITKTEIENEIDQIILHLSWSKNIKKFILLVIFEDCYKLPCSFFSLQGLEHLSLTNCDFELPLMFNGFSMLKSLVFNQVEITANTLQRFLTSCPLLEEFNWMRDELQLIELTECEFVELFKCLPSIQVLEISQIYIEHLDAGDMPHKLPISLPHLRILVLDVCFLELSFVLCMISSSPNLEKIKVDMCWMHDQFCRFQQTDNNLPDIQDYTGLNLDLFKEMEIRNFRDCGSWMKFVKLIMAKSPVLKKARIELSKSVSVEEEVRMLRDLLYLPLPRASPAGKFIMERPKK